MPRRQSRSPWIVRASVAGLLLVLGFLSAFSVIAHTMKRTCPVVLAAEMPTEANWIRHHHSRLDGHGYPDQIGGGDIPIESRIIFVADSFEAMTSDRPYRKAPGRQFAINELRRCAGTQFDPKVVETLCQRLGEFADHAEPEERDASRELSTA